MPDLVLAGGGGANDWLERTARPPLAGRVQRTGYLDTPALRALFAGARVLVLPSLDEGFGLPALEAMTVGVPVVASNRGALPEVVGDAGVLVDPTDTTAIADALERVLTDDALAAGCTARGLRRARAFNWQASARSLRRAYRTAIEGPDAAGGNAGMRIGVDGKELLGRRTGVGRYLASLCVEWSGAPAYAGHELLVYTPRPLPPEAPLPTRTGPGARLSLATIPGAGGPWWEQRSLARRAAADRLDVFFGPGYSVPLVLDVPSVVTLHDVSFTAHPEWFGWREGLRRRWLAARAAASARAVIAVSEFSRQEILGHLGTPPARVRVIHNGVAAPSCAGPPGEPPLPAASGAPWCCTSARCSHAGAFPCCLPPSSRSRAPCPTSSSPSWVRIARGPPKTCGE